MRTLSLFLILDATILLSAACGSNERPASSAGGAQTRPTLTREAPVQSASQPDAPPTAVAHGTPPLGQTTPPAGGPASVDTSALDKKVEEAEAKAKAPQATRADKMAAAAAYLERGNVFYIAGNPSLYKFALRDFRRTLRYDPNNAEARAKQKQIIDIYQSMGRPVPDLGNEP
jgi:hypothetical protein